VLRVLHVITGLNVGGAGNMLERLVQQGSAFGFESTVISLVKDDGVITARLAEAGIVARSFHMSRSTGSLHTVPLLQSYIRRLKPHVVQTWTYHADLIAGLVSRSMRGTRVVWGIHHARIDSDLKLRTRLVALTCARVSRFIPDRIVCVSKAGMAAHVAAGYCASKVVVIPNGFDTASFRPDTAARQHLRSELGLDPAALLIGVVARDHPHKGIKHFVAAAGEFAARTQDVHFVVCGAGLDKGPQLPRSVGPDRLHFLGKRHDVARILAGIDVYTSPSEEEAFPLAVGEAMSCGVPCVVTDVGDSAELVGDTGVVVEPRDPSALVRGWDRLLSDRSRLGTQGAAARKRIIQCFELRTIAERYYALYRSLVRQQPAPAVAL